MTLKQRLYLASALLFLLTFLGGGGLIVLNAREAVLAETRSSFQLARQLLHEASPDLLQQLASSRHLKVLPDGEEKIAAPGWFILLTLPEELRFEVGPFQVATDPSDEIEEAWREAKLFFSFLLLLAASSTLLLWWTVAKFLRELHPLLSALTAIQNGDYTVRLSPSRMPELDRIARAFNQMAEALEEVTRKNHRLLQQLLQIQEEERRRLAHDLHDDLGQTLSGLKMAAYALAHQEAQPLVELADHALRTLRDLLNQLQPSELETLGLEAALRALTERWRQVVPQIELEAIFSLVGRLAPEREIHLYRIAQEALANAIRHSGASRVELRLEEEEDHIRLLVRDNGRGLDPGRAKRGLGLTSLAERVAFLGGRLTIFSHHGTAIEVILPKCDSSSSTTTPSSASA